MDFSHEKDQAEQGIPVGYIKKGIYDVPPFWPFPGMWLHTFRAGVPGAFP
jgi:hypothetical protein